MSQKNTNCINCRRAEKVFYSLDRVYSYYGSDEIKHNIFTHNGNLIAYAKLATFKIQCDTCHNRLNDCVYIKDSKYCTQSKHSNVTVIDCAIKKLLHKNEVSIMSADIGLFLMP